MKAKTGIREEYVTLGGHALALNTLPEEHAEFLARVREALENPDKTPQDLTALVWSEANPLLELGLIPGRAMATRETYENPAFRVMLDYIDRKRAATGDLDLERAQARYSMTVPEAAEALGIAESTVRRAVQEGRLDGWKKGGVYYLDPNAVESYRISVRGLRAEVQFKEAIAREIEQATLRFRSGDLDIRFGTEGNYFLRYKGPMMTPSRRYGPHSPVQTGMIQKGWNRVALLRGKKKEQDYRFFELVPTEASDTTAMELSFAGFFVRGGFRIARKINNPRKALEAWEAFEGA